MFLAGLEMDMEGLKKNRNRVMAFGMLTFLVPFAMTYLWVSVAFGLYPSGIASTCGNHGF